MQSLRRATTFLRASLTFTESEAPLAGFGGGFTMVFFALVVNPMITFVLQTCLMIEGKGFFLNNWWFVLYEYDYFLVAWWIIYRGAQLTTASEELSDKIHLRMARGDVTYLGEPQQIAAFLRLLAQKGRFCIFGMVINRGFVVKVFYAVGLITFTMVRYLVVGEAPT